MSVLVVMSVLLPFAVAAPEASAETQSAAIGTYERWEKGVSNAPSFFPIAVWLQAPRNAERFRNAGINLYVGLWKGPTEEQLRALKTAGMATICAEPSRPEFRKCGDHRGLDAR